MKIIKLNEIEAKILAELVFRAIEKNAISQMTEESKEKAKTLVNLHDILTR